MTNIRIRFTLFKNIQFINFENSLHSSFHDLTILHHFSITHLQPSTQAPHIFNPPHIVFTHQLVFNTLQLHHPLVFTTSDWSSTLCHFTTRWSSMLQMVFNTSSLYCQLVFDASTGLFVTSLVTCNLELILTVSN